MARLRTLIVDDERLARSWICGLLKEHPQIEVVAEVADIPTAIEKVKENVDVVFLDIQLPPYSGFDLLPYVPAGTHVVFVTAYDAFAIKAFAVNALDYLLKPVHPDRLAETISRLISASNGTKASVKVPEPGMLLLGDLVSIVDRGLLRVIPVNQIAAICADSSYTNVFVVEKGALYVSRPISDWERSLPAPPFARLDRSILLNLALVREAESISRNRTQVTLAGGDVLTIGRSASQRLRKLLRQGTSPR